MNLSKMTPAQVRAVTTDHSNVYVVAGPGSGKTTVLAHRLRRLPAPSRVAAITYTNAAARNLEERAGSFDAPLHLGYAGTLHGFCLRMLREHGEGAGYGPRVAVLDQEASDELLKAKMASAGCDDPLKAVRAVKAQGRPVPMIGQPFSKAQIAVSAYCDELFASGLLDFDLILTEFLRTLMRKDGNLWQAVHDRFDHLLVDEVQDSAAVDWLIYRRLPIDDKFLVGDPDQAIFGFRGGRAGLSVDHAVRDGVEVIYLDDNFRCSPSVCDAANRLIGHNAHRLVKFTVPARTAPTGSIYRVPVPFSTDRFEVAAVSEAIKKFDGGYTVAILARTNAIAEPFRDAIKALGVLVEEAPKSEMPSDWGRAQSMLEFLAQPENDTLAFLYLVAVCKGNGDSDRTARQYANKALVDARAAGKSLNRHWFAAEAPADKGDVVNYVSAWADKEKLCLESRALIVEMVRAVGSDGRLGDLALEAARRNEPAKPKGNGGVTVTTIHDAKGREWDEVYLVGMEDQAIPSHRKDTDVDEERRLFFVGLTRARYNVWIMHAASRTLRYPNGFEEVKARTPSRFIEEACR